MVEARGIILITIMTSQVAQIYLESAQRVARFHAILEQFNYSENVPM